MNQQDKPEQRRSFLVKATRAAAAMFVASGTSSAKEISPIRIGVLLGTFRTGTLAERLDRVKASGLDCVQLSMDCAGLQMMPDEITPELAKQVRSEAAALG